MGCHLIFVHPKVKAILKVQYYFEIESELIVVNLTFNPNIQTT